MTNFTDDIFGRVAYICEGFSGVVNFTNGYEHCNHIEDTGVKVLKIIFALELLIGA